MARRTVSVVVAVIMLFIETLSVIVVVFCIELI